MAFRIPGYRTYEQDVYIQRETDDDSWKGVKKVVLLGISSSPSAEEVQDFLRKKLCEGLRKGISGEGKLEQCLADLPPRIKKDIVSGCEGNLEYVREEIGEFNRFRYFQMTGGYLPEATLEEVGYNRRALEISLDSEKLIDTELGKTWGVTITLGRNFSLPSYFLIQQRLKQRMDSPSVHFEGEFHPREISPFLNALYRSKKSRLPLLHNICDSLLMERSYQVVLALLEDDFQTRADLDEMEVDIPGMVKEGH